MRDSESVLPRTQYSVARDTFSVAQIVATDRRAHPAGERHLVRGQRARTPVCLPRAFAPARRCPHELIYPT
ncbi:hypothetical protein Lesp02_03490 [Lentzea sp. NBRC 105346]|uniref:hypothetical protein n=1 Tax=Lentzea sp. NBRC 105346 TaxID=3032205 RepID=UPI0024A1108E|nr:hypothetical protein [Lentzea sp. NBRC 105346]GLZ28159.1 hypothetical protein Lesp02_03490 [Lentzea sp. NBRC 105346]